MEGFTDLTHTGSEINYYFVCKRKLWLFSHNIELESDSDIVLQGRLLHEHSYKRKLKEIAIDKIKIDFIEKTNEVHEIKRSRRVEDAHVFQLLYYLYYLKKHAGLDMRGVLNYPLLKKTVKVELTTQKEKKVEQIIQEISKIKELKKPPEATWIPYCKSCAYSEMCWG